MRFPSLWIRVSPTGIVTYTSPGIFVTPALFTLELTLDLEESDMSGRPFRVLLVSNDRKILRQTSRFLRMFGFVVQQATSLEMAQCAIDGQRPDFLVVGADSLDRQQLQTFLGTLRAETTSVYTAILCRQLDDATIREFLASGVDEFLQEPIVYGELLARLRAGARALENERRYQQQSTVDPETGLLNEAALLFRLQAEVDESPSPISCVLLDIDYLQSLERRHGESLCKLALSRVAEALRQNQGECKFLASPKPGRFCAVLNGVTELQAADFAERLRTQVKQIGLEVPNGTVHLTASLGIAGFEAEMNTAEDLLQAAEQALATAKSSGRDFVARSHQFANETRDWEELATQGRIFETTQAGDIMSPISLTLKQEDRLAQAVNLIRQSQLIALPVVDEQGRLVGLVNAEHAKAFGGRNTAMRLSVAEVMETEIAQFDAKTRFLELLEHFTSNSGAIAVIVEQQRPIGILQCSEMAALSEPLTTESFTTNEPFSLRTDYLLTPSCPREA